MKSNAGASAVEYGIVIAAVSLAAISAVSAFGTDIRDNFLTTSDALAGSSSEPGQSSPSGPSIFNHFPVDSELTAQPAENCIEDTAADDFYVSRGTGPVADNELSYNCITFAQQGTDYLEWTEGSTASPLQVAVSTDYSGTLDITSGPGADYFEIYGRAPGSSHNLVTLNDVTDEDIIYFDTSAEYAAAYVEYTNPTQWNEASYLMTSGQFVTDENEIGTILQISGTPSSLRFNNGTMSMSDFEQLWINLALENWVPGDTNEIRGGGHDNTFDVRGYTVTDKPISIAGNEGQDTYIWDGFGDVKVTLHQNLYQPDQPDQPDIFTVSGKTLADIDALYMQSTDAGDGATISTIYLIFDQGDSIISGYNSENLGYINLSDETYTVDELFDAYSEMGNQSGSY